MKEFSYKIGDISRLYDMSSDALRYYEKEGLLSPRRHANGYRYYTISDICILNVIRNLRGVDIPLKQVRQYVQQRNLASTMELIEHEFHLLQERIEVLEAAKANINVHSKRIAAALAGPKDTLQIKQLRERRCWFHKTPHIFEGEIDYYLNELVAEQDLSIHHLINTPAAGAVIDHNLLKKNDEHPFSGVFLLSVDDTSYNFSFPNGTYACFLYQGLYRHPGHIYTQIKDQLREKGYVLNGNPLALYLIDEHDTNNPDEYITELQFPIAKL